MVRREEHMLKFYLIFSIYFLINVLQGNDSMFYNTKMDSAIANELDENYPGKPLIMSLILPGSGQFYNKAPLWKTLSFFGVELGALLMWRNSINTANRIKKEYQEFADVNWDVDTWVYNRFNPTTIQNEEMSWTNFAALNKLTGTHHINLILSGALANELNLNEVSSDSLEMNPDWIGTDEIQVVRDRHFYENIGKYDQFLGGWSDAREAWYWEEKDVGDSIEVIIKTPKKKSYIDQRYESNQKLSLAKYSITVLMFNHVISGIESVWHNQRKARNKKNSNTKLSLIYNPYNSYGVGGLSLHLNF